MLTDMMSRAKQMRDSMVALKKAPDAQTALAALTNLSGSLQGTNQAIATQFQNLGAAPATGAATGVIGNQVAATPNARWRLSAGRQCRHTGCSGRAC